MYKYIHTCIYIHISCPHTYTHTHIHIYTHTHTKCTYERTQITSETTARQRLHGQPNLTPRSSALLPVRITTARRPDHIRLSALVWSRSTQFIVHASSQLGHAGPWPPETRSFFCHFGGVSLLECYPDGSGVPSPDTARYTLGDFRHDLFWDQGAASEGLLDTDIPVVKELVLRYADQLDWIKKEHTTILAFLPLPHIDIAESRGPKGAQPTVGK